MGDNSLKAGKELAGESTETLRAAEADGQAGLAGRELDAAIAERVMGWTLTRRGGTGKYRDSMYWKGAPNKYSQVDWHWNPSTDIAAAMEVRDHVRDTWKFSARREFTVELIMIVSQRLAPRTGVQLADSSVLMNFTAEDLCRAALAAVAHNEPE